MTHHHHAPRYYTAVRFTAANVGEVWMFRDRYDNQVYTAELLDCVTMPVAEVDEAVIYEFHLKPDVAVEQIWLRITPEFDRDRLVVGFEETYADLYTEDAKGPVAIGLQIDPSREIGKNAFMASALKANKDAQIEWKIEVFRD